MAQPRLAAHLLEWIADLHTGLSLTFTSTATLLIHMYEQDLAWLCLEVCPVISSTFIKVIKSQLEVGCNILRNSSNNSLPATIQGFSIAAQQYAGFISLYFFKSMGVSGLINQKYTNNIRLDWGFHEKEGQHHIHTAVKSGHSEHHQIHWQKLVIEIYPMKWQIYISSQ